MARKKQDPVPPSEVEVIDKAKSDDASSSATQSTGTGSSSNPKSNSKAEAKLRKKFDSSSKLQLDLVCPSIKDFTTSRDLDVETVVEELARYCKIVCDNPTLSLHSPMAVLQALLHDVIVGTTEKDMLKGAVNDCFYTLDTQTQAVFKPLLTKLKDSSLCNTTSDVINRRRLIALDSQEIQMGGQKLNSATTPMELDAFIDSMERAVETRSEWRRHLQVNVPDKSGTTKSGRVVKWILKDFRTISQKSVQNTNFHRSEALRDASLAMYNAITATMSVAFRCEMRLYRDKINNQGPKLLYFILRKLTKKDSRIVADFQLNLTTLEKAFKESGFDMHVACPVLFDSLQQYKCAGGNPETHYSLISTTLLSMHCDALTSLVREWEQAQMRNHNKKSIFDLLQKLPIFVTSLIADNTWPHKSSNTSKDFNTQFKALQTAAESKTSTEVSKSDLTAFKAQIESMVQKSQSKAATIACKAMLAHTAKKKADSSSTRSSTTPPAPTKVKKMTYRWGPDKWGDGLLYKNKDEFNEFYRCKIPGMDKMKSYEYVGLTWKWCETCNRMGSHDTPNHRDNKYAGNKRKQGDVANLKVPPVGEANNAVADIEIQTTASFDASIDDFDAEAAMKSVEEFLNEEDGEN